MGSVKFSKEFITPLGTREWVTLDWEVGVPFDSQKAMETFTSVKEFVCNYQSSSPGFPDNSFAPVPPREVPVINKEEERLEILIDNAATVDELLKYKGGQLSTAALSAAWYKRYHQLTDITTNA